MRKAHNKALVHAQYFFNEMGDLWSTIAYLCLNLPIFINSALNVFSVKLYVIFHCGSLSINAYNSGVDFLNLFLSKLVLIATILLPSVIFAHNHAI